jgi:putative flavoprotein involved in K+ transport
MGEDVLVIGAGPAGLTAAYYLEKAGISYRIVDRAGVIGSTWANLYPSLRLNTANFVSSLPGMPVSWRGGFYMTGRQFYAELERFAKRYDFKVQLRVEVERVTPENGGWRVDTSEGSDWFPCVIIATGKYGQPILPSIPGLKSFGGQVLHAQQFHDANDFRGQRVLVVGNGPTGVDVAVLLSETAQSPVRLSVRNDMVVARRYPYGLPETVWRIILSPLPESIREKVRNHISYQTYPELRKYGIPLAPNRTDRKGTGAPYRGPEFLNALKSGNLKVVAGVDHFDAGGVLLTDGTYLELDTVVVATGYRPVVNYLNIPFEQDKDGWPVRDEGQQVAGAPGLYIVGRFYQGLGPLWNMKVESKVAIDQIRERLKQVAKQPTT